MPIHASESNEVAKQKQQKRQRSTNKGIWTSQDMNRDHAMRLAIEYDAFQLTNVWSSVI